MLWDLQQGLYAALTADAALMARVGGVFDQVPQNTPFAYVVIGDDESDPFDDDRDQGFDTDCTIHTWGRAHGGRREIKLIQSEVHRVLHRTPFAVAGAHTIESFVELTDSYLDPDGITYHGVQRVRVITEAE